MTTYELPEGMTADVLRDLAEDMSQRGGWSTDAATVAAWADAIDPPKPGPLNYCRHNGAMTNIPCGDDCDPMCDATFAYPRRFALVRDEDVTGVSGTGVVAEGVAFHNGPVALRWRSEWPTSVVFHDRGIESLEAVHGHGGRTRIEWIDK